MSAPLRLAAPAVLAVSDAELVERALGGDREAFSELVRSHQEGLYRYMRGMGLDHDPALDLVQDAFVRAYVRLAECRERARFRAWLTGIARNLCLDHLKNVRRRIVSLGKLGSADAIADPRCRAPDADLTLRRALERLPTAMREAFLLKHDAGYGYEEIADATGASVSAVKMRVHRARESLRTFLLEQEKDAS